MKANWKIEVDTHTHTVLSGHAWSTLKENCQAAAAIGLKGLCLTEHGPNLPGSMPEFGPVSMRLLPEFDCGVRIIPGLELDIIDFDGNLDVYKKEALEQIHFGIASMHNVTIKRGSREENTAAYVNALKNPYVDILGHPGYSYYSINAEEIVQAAKAQNKLIEINNNSFASRKGSHENCLLLAKLCMEYDVRICVSSDAHYHTMVGQVALAAEMLNEIDFPEALILNSDYGRFMLYMEERAKRIKNA